MFLKRLDNLGVAIDKLIIDHREGVILGRGPVTKITDTKISRNHAKIIYDEEKKSLVFINVGKHTCYIKRSKEETEFSFVERNKTVEIGDGSVFGLLPDKYIYEICDWRPLEKHTNSTWSPDWFNIVRDPIDKVSKVSFVNFVGVKRFKVK